MKSITENNIEDFALETLRDTGWEYMHGLAIAPGAGESERENFEQIILLERLRKAVGILNPDIPANAQEQAVQKVLRIQVQAENREHLKDLLKVASGGIVFTTIQKFLPEGLNTVYDQLSGSKNKLPVLKSSFSVLGLKKSCIVLILNKMQGCKINKYFSVCLKKMPLFAPV